MSKTNINLLSELSSWDIFFKIDQIFDNIAVESSLTFQTNQN